MRASGGFLVPTLGGQPWMEKPPFVLWLMAAALGLPVPPETAVRLPSAAGLAAAGWFTFRLGAAVRSPREGLLACAILLLSPLALASGAAATMDAVLLASTTAALSILAAAPPDAPRRRDVLALGVALALGQLTKGPVGLLLPLLSAAPALLLGPPAARRGFVRLVVPAASLSLLAYLAWAVPANAASSGLLFSEGFGVHVLGRVLSPMESHGGWGPVGLLFHPAVLVVTFCPWTLFAVAGLREIGPPAASRGAALLAGSVAVPLLLFSAVATKLPHYVLPALPALAIASAAGVLAPLPGRRGRCAGPALLLLGSAAWLGLLAFAAGHASPPLRAFALAIVVLFVLSSGAGLALFVLGRRVQAAAALGAGFALSATLVAGAVLPAFEPFKPVPPVAAAARRAAPFPVASFGFGEPSLTFYAGPGPIERLPSDRAVRTWTRRPGGGVLVTTGAEAARLSLAGEGRLVLLARAVGIDLVHGRPTELVAFLRAER